MAFSSSFFCKIIILLVLVSSVVPQSITKTTHRSPRHNKNNIQFSVRLQPFSSLLFVADHRNRILVSRHKICFVPELSKLPLFCISHKHRLSIQRFFPWKSSSVTATENHHKMTACTWKEGKSVDERSSSPSLTDASSGSESFTSTSTPSWMNVDIVQPHVGYKKVLVTGGAGFIGSHVAAHLLERGDDVVVVDEVNDYYDVHMKEQNVKILLSQYSNDRVKFYRGDICDEEFMTTIFEVEKPTWVCHMAARAGVRPSIQDPFVYIHSNIIGTTRLLELSVRYHVRNFVFASSSSVYGDSTSTYFSEEEVVDRPVSPYAATKKACELLAFTYHSLYQLPISALRFFTVYGPRGRPDMAPFKFIDRISRGLEIQQFGDGSSSRDYTYIDDIVNGVVRSIDRPYGYQIFNLGKGDGTSLSDFISLVQKYTEKKAVIRVLPDQPGDVPYTCADVSKAECLLGYRSKVSFEEGIKRTVEWYQNAYERHEIVYCPETQANGLGRAPSTSDLLSMQESLKQQNETEKEQSQHMKEFPTTEIQKPLLQEPDVVF